MRSLLLVTALAACTAHAAQGLQPDVVHEDWHEHDPVADPTRDLVRPDLGATPTETARAAPDDPVLAVWDRVAASALAIVAGGWGPLVAWEVSF